ncbi:SDR family NAD(P)-dependent oxidoreductase [Bacteroidota bacterium]
MAYGRFDNPVVATLTGILDLFRKQDLAKKLRDNNRVDGKTVVITGANSGLGFALAVDLAKRGGYIIMACRREIPEAGEKVKSLSGSENVSMVHLDLGDIDSIHGFCSELTKRGLSIDLLILNAGVASPKATPTKSGLDEIFLVNYLANFMLVNLLLHQGIIPNRTCASNRATDDTVPRILFISSDSHQGSSYIDYDEFGRYFEYGLKKGMNNYSYYKLVLNTLAIELSRRINKDNVDVSILTICPGPVNTNIIRSAPWLVRIILRGIFSIFFQSPRKAAKPVVYMGISEDYNERTEEYLHMFNPKKMDFKVYIPEEGEKLWHQSAAVWKSVDPNAIICKQLEFE